MKKINNKNTILKLSILIVILIVSILSCFIFNSLATELNEKVNVEDIQFLSEENTNIVDQVGGRSVEKNWPASHVISKSSFKSEINSHAFTALSSNRAIYCLLHGGRLFNQGSHSTLVRWHDGNVNIEGEIDDRGNPNHIKYEDHKEATEGGSQKTETHLVYKDPTEFGLSKIQAYAVNFNNDGDAYHNSAQEVIWNMRNSLYRAGSAVQSLQEELKNRNSDPNVNPIKNGDDGCGTKLVESDQYYRIGPFKMTDYAYVVSKDAANYSGKGLKYPEIVGGIVGGKITLDNGKELDFDTQVQIEYEGDIDNDRGSSGSSGVDYYRKDNGKKVEIIVELEENSIVTYYKNSSGKKVKVEIYEKDGKTIMEKADGTKITLELRETEEKVDYWGSPDSTTYKYPWPNSVFYIKVKRSDCGNATTLKSMTFDYRETDASGTGLRAEGTYVETNFTIAGEDTGCTTYSANHEYHGKSLTVTNSKGGTHSVQHTHKCTDCSICCTIACCNVHNHHVCKDADGVECNEADCAVQGPPPPNCHCACKGHNIVCNAPLEFKCEHNHIDCKVFNWKGVNTVKKPQPLLGVKEANVTVYRTPFERDVNVRLTTDLQINKYIVKVDHVGETINLYNNNTERKRKYSGEPDIKWKKDNTVKVERGDIVTYKIDILNTQNQKVKCKIQDILPEASANASFTPKIDGEWLEVPANGKKTITVTLKPTADTGIHENTAKIVTSNKGLSLPDSPDYNRTVYESSNPRNNGPVVNIAELNGGILEDKDFYEIKEYNVNIEKYIYDVEHNQSNIGISDIDTTLKATNERMRRNLSEANKESAPVYSEYGDTITYKIVVHNTTKGTGSGFDVDRAKKPYWNPDKVYVSIKDTLPKKYSNLKVTIDRPVETGNASHTISELPVSSTNGGTFTITDLMVPAGKTRTVTVTLTVEEYSKGTIEKNTAEFVGSIKNINRGPRAGSTVANKYCVIKNNAPSSNLISSDWYKINNYNTFMDKYIYKYDEKMQKQNNSNGYTSGGLITNEDGTLKTSRENTNTTTSTVSDGNVVDTIRNHNGKDSYKKEHPVSAEKTETLVYALKVSNEATDVTKEITSGAKPATQVRTTKVTDYMEEGLQFKSVTATMYNKDGNIITRYNEKGEVAVKVSEPTIVTIDGKNYNKYEFTIGNETILNPGEYIIYYVTTEIIESNMYLDELENRSELTTLTNINNTDTNIREIKNKDHNENISIQQTSSDYVRLKDLVIAGKVWLDFNRDGYINDELRTDADKAYYNLNNNAMKRDVVVRLYSDNGTLLRTTKTDENGLYTFGRDSGFKYYGTYNHDTGFSKDETYQRVDKASNKDNNGNYTNESKYLNYYIEFEYDGIIYKSTEYYSGMDNLNGDSKSADYGKYDINYPIDSNAAEFKDVREKFNDTYEYISYDVAYGTDLEQKGQTVDPQTGVVTTATVEDNTNSSARLSFDKTGHTSQLMDEPSRIMTARSFIKNTTRKDLVSQSENPDGWVNNEIKNSSIENTNLLWLFKHNENTNSETPATEYLKYINLGLELRENVDIALTKDVYKVKTTIDGEQIEYTLNQNNGLNGDMPNYDYNSGNGENGPSTYLNNYICPAPYGLDLYESDYKMRIEQYKANAVKAYKGLNAESELNVEVTYRITVANKAINDDQSVNGNNVKDTKLGVKVHEILDLYDENFMQIQFNPDGTIKTGAIPAHEINSKAKTNSGNYNEITVKNKDENGYLVDAKIAIGEAWYFRKIEEGSNVAPENRYRIDENSKLPLTYNNEIGQTVDVESKQTQSKPVYIQDVNGEYEKVPLVLRSQSYRDGKGKYSYKENNDDFSADGYNTLYISGMGNVLINEGEDLDIYVKYVLDKEAIEMENTNEDYEETKNTETTSSSSSTTTGNTLVTTVENTIKETSEKKVKIDRSLKIAERILGVVSNKNTEVDGTAPNVVARKDSGRGLEGIAEVNAYSVWYADGSEAALVDMDSNAGNIGNQNSNLIDKLKDEKDTSTRKTILDTSKNEKASNYVSGDEYTYYEDMTYKTGIELTADGTEWTKEQVNEKWKNKKIKIITQKVEDKTIRELSGMVWDDTRSESSGVAGDTQYIGDGIYDTSIKKQEQALMNDNIGVNYKNNKAQEILYNLIGRDKNKELDEEQDIKVRNAKAELVEIVEIPQSTGESHYYEQVLSNVTWEQVQHLRTNAEGEYLLKGFVPGKYIVRFTYGDTIKEEDLSAQEKAFLGEDTKYVTSDMQIFNGQDYKTTQFAYEMEDYRVTEGKGNNSQENLATVSDDAIGTIDNYATDSSKTPKNINNDDEVLAALERPNLSDARDDEIRRLDVNNYSEIMINKKAEILKGLANGTKLTNSSLGTDNEISVNYYKNFENSEYQSQREEALKELTNNTHMNAETVEFLVKPEKLTYEQTTSEENIYHNYIANDSNIYYDELETIEYKTTNNRKYKIQNIDMGIEYRPETAISLIKEIKDIQLVTSDGNILVDLKLYTKQEDNGKITHHVDMENSIGAELVQFITNEYEIDPLLNSILGEDNSAIGANEEQQQGFMYIAVDDDILQGCRVILQYKFTAQNNSEIDRISESLNSIRFYGNTKTQELINSYQGLKHTEIDSNGNIIDVVSNILDESNETDYNKDEYTANNLARNMVYYDVYSLDSDGIEYRNRAKTMTKLDDDIDQASMKYDTDGTEGYFGKYVGYAYYTGNPDAKRVPRNETEAKNLDMISELKFDKIIDYIDTNLEFGQLSQTDITQLQNLESRATTSTTEPVGNLITDVVDKNYTGNQFWSNNSSQSVSRLSDYLFSLNSPWGQNVSNPNEETLENVLTDLDGVKYKSLVITTADKQSEDDPNTKNKAFSKFLKPSIMSEEDSIANVYLPVSKLLSSAEDTNNMVYENIAEVIQFTVLTGRRTNFATTVGNADIHEVYKQTKDEYERYGSIEFVTAAYETDTSATETITLAPPTGLMRNRRVIYETIDTTKNIVQIVVIAIAVVVVVMSITRFTILKIKKKRYK